MWRRQDTNRKVCPFFYPLIFNFITALLSFTGISASVSSQWQIKMIPFTFGHCVVNTILTWWVAMECSINTPTLRSISVTHYNIHPEQVTINSVIIYVLTGFFPRAEKLHSLEENVDKRCQVSCKFSSEFSNGPVRLTLCWKKSSSVSV